MREPPSDSLFRLLFEGDLPQIEYPHHPADAALRGYLKRTLRRAWRVSPQRVEQLAEGRVSEWSPTELSAHLLTCPRCKARLAQLRSAVEGEREPLRLRLRRRFRPRLWRWRALIEAVRRPPAWAPTAAVAVIVAQTFMIVALGGLLYFKPAFLFPRQGAPTAVSISSGPSPSTVKSSSGAAGASPGRAQPTPDQAQAQALLAMRSEDPSSRARAARALGESGEADDQAVKLLIRALDDPAVEVRQAAAEALNRLRERVESQYHTVLDSLSRLGERLQGPGALGLLNELFGLDLLTNGPGPDLEELISPPAVFQVVFREGTGLEQAAQISRQVDGVLIGPDEEHRFLIKIRLDKRRARVQDILAQLRQNPWVQSAELVRRLEP